MSRLVGSARAAKTRDRWSATTDGSLFNELVEEEPTPPLTPLSTNWLKNVRTHQHQVLHDAEPPGWFSRSWTGRGGILASWRNALPFLSATSGRGPPC